MDITLEPWPALPLSAWAETYATIHRWAQVVGKVKLELSPMTNHWWQVALVVTPRGLTTGAVPYRDGAFSLDFDFIGHRLLLKTSTGHREWLALEPRAVAEFYDKTMRLLHKAGIDCTIWDVPVEIPGETTRFRDDWRHAAYDPEYARHFGRVLVQAHLALEEFRARFRGKCSPVSFYWGSFDLAVTRFSGRPAPPRPDADAVTREAYSEEVSSVGFWPGTAGVSDAAFYAYASPEPPGFRTSPVRPVAAGYDPRLSEFVLPYEAVRAAPQPHQELLDFCETTYAAAATLGGWDRERLEWAPVRSRSSRPGGASPAG